MSNGGLVMQLSLTQKKSERWNNRAGSICRVLPYKASNQEHGTWRKRSPKRKSVDAVQRNRVQSYASHGVGIRTPNSRRLPSANYRNLQNITWSMQQHHLRKKKSGIYYILYRMAPFIRKTLWTIVITITVLGCAYLCQQRIAHYFSDPSEINTYFVENKTVTFPSATLCPWHEDIPSINTYFYEQRFGNYSKKWLYDLFNESSNHTFDDLWDVARIDKNWTQFSSSLDSANSSDVEKYEFFEVDTIQGRCTTFIGRKSIPHYGVQSDQTVMTHGANSKLNLFKIQFHATEDIDLVKYLIFNNGIEYTYESWDFFLRATEVIYRNTAKNPCSNDMATVSKCRVDCLERDLYSKVKKKCRLPYMQKNVDVAPCTTPEEFTDVLETSIYLGRRFHKDNCNCSKNCREILYSTEFVISTFKPEDRNLLRLWMGFGDPQITVVEEMPSYNGFALFSDLGGSVGLFLGISAMQIFQIIANAFNKIL